MSSLDVPIATDADPRFPSELLDYLVAIHARHRSNGEGEVATYIPELGKAEPTHFGVALATADGRVASVGDARVPFTIQSISKPFVFALAVHTFGRNAVLKRVGVEPSGDAFNAIILDERTKRPFNPMVNAGAIATTAMLCEQKPAAGWESILGVLSGAAGRNLAVDEAVFLSERSTGGRNRAISWLLHSQEIVRGDVEASLDAYFRQCSVLVTARDLAMMGATLANLGTNPLTGVQVLDVAAVQDALSVMFTCGMYNFAGEWAFRVGIPAKSGVAGGILAVVNRLLGLGAYSPRLDAAGNSVRGTRACIDLADEMGMHSFGCTNVGSDFLRGMLSHLA